jgi:hypothetical protein
MAAVDKADRQVCQLPTEKNTAFRQSHWGLTSVTTRHLSKESAFDISRGFFHFNTSPAFQQFHGPTHDCKKNSTYAFCLLVSCFLALTSQRTPKDMQLTPHLLRHGRKPRAITVAVSAWHTKPHPTRSSIEREETSLLICAFANCAVCLATGPQLLPNVNQKVRYSAIC